MKNLYDICESIFDTNKLDKDIRSSIFSNIFASADILIRAFDDDVLTLGCKSNYSIGAKEMDKLYEVGVRTIIFEPSNFGGNIDIDIPKKLRINLDIRGRNNYVRIFDCSEVEADITSNQRVKIINHSGGVKFKNCNINVAEQLCIRANGLINFSTTGKIVTKFLNLEYDSHSEIATNQLFLALRDAGFVRNTKLENFYKTGDLEELKSVHPAKIMGIKRSSLARIQLSVPGGTFTRHAIFCEYKSRKSDRAIWIDFPDNDWSFEYMWDGVSF